MDFINEGIALGVDLLILGLCVREYTSFSRHITRLKEAPQLSIGTELKDHVEKQPNKKVSYAVIRGAVVPLGAPIRSQISPAVTGVLQVMKLNEHRVARGFAGFWTEQQKLIHVSSVETPFGLRGDNQIVEIIDPLSAALLDLDVVYDNYEPSSLSFFDHIFGFFTGVRQKGLQTTAEVLREGSIITAIGELESDGNALRLQRSPVGPLYLTTSTKTSLIKKFEDMKSSTLVKIVIFGTISSVLVGLIIRKLYLRRKQERENRRIKEALDKERRTRRAQNRTFNLTAEQVCVVCSMNPKEIIILPCGHVCLCEDCATKIQRNCPVCRGKITTKAAAFIT